MGRWLLVVRCLVVVAVCTGGWSVAVASTTPLLLAGPAPRGAGEDSALTWVCAALLLVGMTMLWLALLHGVLDAWRGRPLAGHGPRRWALLACGVGLSVALASPAGAVPSATPAPTAHATHDLIRGDLTPKDQTPRDQTPNDQTSNDGLAEQLNGLPLPELPEGPAGPTGPAGPQQTAGDPGSEEAEGSGPAPGASPTGHDSDAAPEPPNPSSGQSSGEANGGSDDGSDDGSDAPATAPQGAQSPTAAPPNQPGPKGATDGQAPEHPGGTASPDARSAGSPDDTRPTHGSGGSGSHRRDGDRPHDADSPWRVVRTGDTLWDLAAGELGADATNQQIAERWQQWYHHNRAAIGADPDLLHPGTRLHRPAAPT